MLMLIVLHCDVVRISTGLIFRHFRKIAKGDYQLRHVYSFVRPFVRMRQLVSHWTIFRKFDISVFFEYLLRKFKLH